MRVRIRVDVWDPDWEICFCVNDECTCSWTGENRGDDGQFEVVMDVE